MWRSEQNSALGRRNPAWQELVETGGTSANSSPRILPKWRHMFSLLPRVALEEGWLDDAIATALHDAPPSIVGNEGWL